MPARRIDIDIQEIAKRYRNGESSDEIGTALKISPNTVLNRLREAGITRRRSGPIPKYDEAICRMYRAGASVAEIVKATGCQNMSTFYDALKRNGVPLRLKRIRNCPHVQNQIKKLHNQGLTQGDIAKIVGINRTYVGDILRQEIVVMRKKWQPAVTVNNKMSVQEMRDAGLTIDEISKITCKSRVDVFEELQP